MGRRGDRKGNAEDDHGSALLRLFELLGSLEDEAGRNAGRSSEDLPEDYKNIRDTVIIF